MALATNITAHYYNSVNNGDDRTTFTGGTVITQWDDISGNDYHLDLTVTNPSGLTEFLTYNLSGDYLQLGWNPDGFSHIYNHNDPVFGGSTGFTVFYVGIPYPDSRQGHALVNQYMDIGNRDNGAAIWFGTNFNTGTTMGLSFYTGSTPSTEDIRYPNYALGENGVSTFYNTGTTMADVVFRKNGVQQTSVSSNGDLSKTLGSFGNGFGLANFSDAFAVQNRQNVFEIICYNRELTPQEIIDVETVLMAREYPTPPPPCSYDIPVVSGLTAQYECLVNDGVDIQDLTEDDNITQWDDLSGQGNHATTITDGSHAYPKYKEFSSFPLFGGIQSSFTGGAYSLFNSLTIPLYSTDKTIFYVGSRNLLAQQAVVFDTSLADDRSGVLVSLGSGSQEMEYWDIDATPSLSNYDVTLGSTERGVFTIALEGGVNVEGKFNGFQKFSDATDSSSNNSITMLGGDEYGGQFQFVMNSFIVYNRLLSDDEILKVEEYLGAKYGVDVLQPPVLAGSNNGNDEVGLSWNDVDDETGYSLERKICDGGSYTEIADISSGVTTYTDSDILFDTEYCYRIRSYITWTGGTKYSSYSNEVQVTITPSIGWCSTTTPYTVTEGTCGNADGIISLKNGLAYTTIYSFTLTDIDGNVYSYNSNGDYTGLTSTYYFLQAIPIGNRLRDTCIEEWIEVTDSDSTIALTGYTKSDVVCGSFNATEGRVIMGFSNVTEPYTYTLYKSNQNFVISGSTSNDLVITPLDAGIYYIIIDDGSCIFLYNFQINDDGILAVPNIQKIFITEWSDGFDVNYWSTANDPDYYGGLDTLAFQSTKIAEYATGLTWYNIIVDEINVNFSQELSKVRQGFIFNDVLTIGIPMNDTEKWNALTTLLASRWVVVFLDANDNWWTFGYKHGAKAEDYTFGSELGGFTLGLKAVSENKIITAIDSQWVTDNIL